MRLLSLDYDGKLLSLVLIGLQLVSIYFGPESVSGRKKDHYQVISDRIFGPEFVSDQNLFHYYHYRSIRTSVGSTMDAIIVNISAPFEPFEFNDESNYYIIISLTNKSPRSSGE